MSPWLINTFLAGFFIGVSFFFRKLATKSSGSVNGFIIEGLVYGVLMVLFFLFQKNKSDLFNHPMYASFSAVFLFFGALFLYKALSLGKVTPVNIIYLMVSIAIVLILSMVFLKEHLDIKQLLGLILGVISIILIRS